MRFNIVHAADLHLDSPLVGLERYEGAPVAEVRGATRRALENLVQLCLDENARLLLLAGDLYDGDWRDYSTGLFFAAQLARLREAGTRVIWIRGNHDAQSKITRHLELADHCTELSTKRPETLALEALDVAVHGQGFATAAVNEDLSASYPEPVRGCLNIGLLHTALSGRRGHAAYAPCDARALAARGYAYWALGHVHQREIVSSEPWIVFPGNLQGRHVRETGEKGASLLRVNDGAIESVEHRALDVVRFAQIEIDAGDASSIGDVAQLAKRALVQALETAAGRLVAARLRVVGRSKAHAEMARNPDQARAQIRSAANEIHGGDAWVEEIKLDTDLPLDLDAIAARDDALGQLLRSLRERVADPETAQALKLELGELERALPPELRGDGLGIDLDDPEQVRELLGAVSSTLLPRLLGGP